MEWKRTGQAAGGPAGRRYRYVAVLAIALIGIALAVTACTAGTAAVGGGAGEGSPAPEEPVAEGAPAPSGEPAGEAATGEPSAIAFAQCMRANGVPTFPDPQPSGGIRVDGSVASNPNFEAAAATCAHLRPTGGAGGAGATDPTVLLEFAQCMREHGVPDFPDPTGAGTGGGITATGQGGPGGINPNSPQFQSALEICGGQYGININIRQ